MTPRRACRKDDLHDAVKDWFEGLGFLWIDTYQHAQYTPGFPDGIVILPGVRVLFIEVKSNWGKQTTDEELFEDALLAAGNDSYRIVRAWQDVLAIVREVLPGWIQEE